MLKALSIIILISLALSACGGARSTDYYERTGFSVSSNSSISWDAPTEYTDQSPLPSSNIGGYRIYVGTTSYNMSLVTTVSSAEETTFSLANVGKGTRYIAVTCYDAKGVESSFSSVLVVNIY